MGIFDDKVDFFATYRARLEFRAKLMGGTPRDPKVIEAWLRAKAGVTQEEEVRQMMVRTLVELGADIDPAETDFEKIMEASESLASARQTQGFKQNGAGPYIESRQIKAMFKESTHSLFAGNKWGPTKKGPKGFLAEHVFVDPDEVSLGINEPTGIEMVIGHITGPQGPRATIGYVEYAQKPTIEFDVLVDEVAQKHIKEENWWKIWVHAQENGLGAMRSQGHGRFDLTQWDQVK